MRRVLITGAAGFLGRAFVGHHLDLGDQVTGVDDMSSGGAVWPVGLDASRRVETDAANWLEANPRAIEEFDVVYHLAAPVGGRLKIEGDPFFNADSLRLDSVFFRWASQGFAGAVVYPSSSAVYGVEYQTSQHVALRESMFQPDQLQWNVPDEMYGFTKLVGEFLAWKAAAYGVNALCIRPFSGYGEGQSLDYPVPSIARRVAAREDPLTVWGSGEQTRDFVYVGDLVGATVARVDAGVHRYAAMNIGSGTATSFRKVAEILAQLEGYRPSVRVDRSKPEGVLNRYSDNAEMQRFYTLHSSLEDGLSRVLEAQRRHLAGK